MIKYLAICLLGLTLITGCAGKKTNDTPTDNTTNPDNPGGGEDDTKQASCKPDFEQQIKYCSSFTNVWNFCEASWAPEKDDLGATRRQICLKKTGVPGVSDNCDILGKNLTEVCNAIKVKDDCAATRALQDKETAICQWAK